MCCEEECEVIDDDVVEFTRYIAYLIECQGIKEFRNIIINSTIENEHGCYIWQGAYNNKGRPWIKGGGAYRVTFSVAYGRPPIGSVRHLCGDKACVNPEHLFDNGVTFNDFDTRFHNYCVRIGLERVVAPRDWFKIGATVHMKGEALFDLYVRAKRLGLI